LQIDEFPHFPGDIWNFTLLVLVPLQGLTLSPVFRGDRKAGDMGAFPTISVGPISTPLGSNTITVTKKSGGNGGFDLNSGARLVPVTLRFDHSLPDLFVGDSDLPLVLTTGTATSPDEDCSITPLIANPEECT
jgi:hypothetical protein